MIVTEGNRPTHALDVVRRGIDATVRCLKKQVAVLDRELAPCAAGGCYPTASYGLVCEIRPMR